MSFSNNVWWTRKSRIQAEKRLLDNAVQSEILLLWYSFFGVATSIYYLKFSTNGDLAGISWVIYSVLLLAITGFVSGRSFKGRAELFKDSYEALQPIYEKTRVEDYDIESATKEYESILGLCENHADIDYTIALCKEYSTSHLPAEKDTKLKPNLDRRPTWYHWVCFVRWIALRYVTLILLYTLPVLLFAATRAFS